MNIDPLEGLCRLSKMEMQYSPFWFCNFLQKALAKNNHLVMQYYSDFDRSWFLYGDKVLGLSGNRPFQWQNGLLIHATMKMVMACANDATDVIVPYGIETLGWNAFICKPNLISLTLPGTVRYYKCAFGECPKLKTVILTGGVSPESPLAKEIKWYFPDATIQYQ